MRLIDVEALIDDCKKYLNKLNPSRDGKECSRMHWLIGILSNAPTIEPDRKTGKWIESPEEKQTHVQIIHECSECGYEAYDYYDMTNFCPNCGSDMRKES